MDELIKQGQWWWLISVPVLTGMFALLGSWWGSRLGKTTEHAQWLRNEKKKDYVEAIKATDNATYALRCLVQGKAHLAPELSSDSDFISSVNVMGPRTVTRTLRQFVDATFKCQAILGEPESETRMARAQAAQSSVNDHYQALLKAMRSDLGVKD